MPLPDNLQVNAWPGPDASNRSPLGDRSGGWGLAEHRVHQPLAADDLPPLQNWRDPRVGWGLILPENTDIPPEKRALAEDAAAPLRRLWEDRGRGPVFRYADTLLPGQLRRYSSDGTARDPKIEGSEEGVLDHQVPRYLLIAGSPQQIPWRLQYDLNLARYTGRLDLDEQGLENYVNALLDDWSTADVSANRPVVWGVDPGGSDITHLLCGAIARPVSEALRNDSQIGDQLRSLFAADATAAKLVDTLAGRKPALIVTTSHGSTFPPGDASVMKPNLGLPVDQNNSLVTPGNLLADWSPDGAIWYAHACCSAGSDAISSYQGLVKEDTSVGRLLKTISEIGSTTAPLPRALLSCKKPLRAFVGHVELTFDWTVRDDSTRQLLTGSIKNALYRRQHLASGAQPVAMAFEELYREVGPLLNQSLEAGRRVIANGELEFERIAIQRQLAAFDRRSQVILGDPTVCLPGLQ